MLNFSNIPNSSSFISFFLFFIKKCINEGYVSFYNFSGYQKFFGKMRFLMYFFKCMSVQFCFSGLGKRLSFNLSNKKTGLFCFDFFTKSLRDFIVVKDLLKIYKLSSFLRFDHLIDMTGVDFLGKNFTKDRFNIFYFFGSLLKTNKQRLLLKFNCSEYSSVFSVSDIFPCANWLEREVWDFFGLRFLCHPDLRRILNDYGFRGFPLRKDFPTIGFKQVRYDESQNSVIYEDLFLTQDERELNFINPWVTDKKQAKNIINVKLYSVSFFIHYFLLKIFPKVLKQK